MKTINSSICPRIYVKEDVPDSEGRMFRNLAILEGRLADKGNRLVPAAEIALVVREIMEIEGV